RRTAVMRQHKYRAVIRRVLPPPAAPGVIGPGTTNRAEHVSSHDPRTDAVPKTRCDIVIGAGGAAGLTMDALERAGREQPFVQSFTTDAEGILASLERAGAVAVERDRKVVHAYTGHCRLPGKGGDPRTAASALTTNDWAGNRQRGGVEVADCSLVQERDELAATA